MRVTIELGGTFPFPGPDTFGNVRPLIRITDLDPEGDVEGQIQLALAVGEKAWVAIDDELAVKLHSMFSVHAGVPTVPEVMRAFENKLATNSENIKRIAEHVRTLTPPMAAAVRSKRGQTKDAE